MKILNAGQVKPGTARSGEFISPQPAGIDRWVF
jgi:hypothetical protein